MKTWLAGGLLFLAGCDILDRGVPFEEDVKKICIETQSPVAVAGRTYVRQMPYDCVAQGESSCFPEALTLYADTGLAYYRYQNTYGGAYSPYVVSPENVLFIWPDGVEKAFYIKDEGAGLEDGYGNVLAAEQTDKLDYFTSVWPEGHTYSGRLDENCGQSGAGFPGMCNPGMVRIFADTSLADYCPPGSDMCDRTQYIKACGIIRLQGNPPTAFTVEENGRRLVGENGEILYLDTAAETRYYHEIPLEGNSYSARPDPACALDALGGFECNPMYVSFGSDGVADFGMSGSDMILKVSYSPVSGTNAVMVGDQEFIILELGRKLQAPDGTILESRIPDIMYLDGFCPNPYSTTYIQVDL